jgi:hypothetical protein
MGVILTLKKYQKFKESFEMEKCRIKFALCKLAYEIHQPNIM